VCRSEVKKVKAVRVHAINAKWIADAVKKALETVIEEVIETEVADALDDGMEEEDIVVGLLDAVKESFERSMVEIEKCARGVNEGRK
jgi:hypothetical protein